ncbi:MAG: hypothetical protein V7720_06865 [Halioglobus sp.]
MHFDDDAEKQESLGKKMNKPIPAATNLDAFARSCARISAGKKYRQNLYGDLLTF